MRQFTHSFEIRTDGKGLYNVTRQIETWVRGRGLKTGLLTVFLKHTSASLTVQENADPDVVLDLADLFQKLAPDNLWLYRHTSEGPDDMPKRKKAGLKLVCSGCGQHVAGTAFKKPASGKCGICRVLSIRPWWWWRPTG